MRILILSPFLPYPPEDGGRMRVFELARGLARRHDVDVLALVPPGPDDQHAAALAALAAEGVPVRMVEHAAGPARALITAARERCSLHGARYRAQPYARALAGRLATDPPDLVQCEYAYMGAYAAARPPRGGPAWVLDEHNVEYRLNDTLAAVPHGPGGVPYRVYARGERWLRRRDELAACRAADHVVAVSDVDRTTLRSEILGLDVSVVPNGIDTGRFRPTPAYAATPPAAVFIGKMDYRPNVDAAVWFAQEILPRVRADLPDFRFVVVGASPAPSVRRLARRPGVEVTGRVPDTRPYLAAAALAVTPLRAGSGTRLKVLEALACGVPVVSTTTGCEGLAVVPGEHVVLADDAAAFARAVVALAGDPAARRRLAVAGRALVEAHYDWQAVVGAIEAVHRRVLDGQRAPA